MTIAAGSLIARLRHAGATLTCSPDGRVRFAASAPIPAALLAEAREHRDAIAAELATDGPSTPCPDCGSGHWWRLSVLSGGPGPWRCMRCVPADPEDWIDGCAVPIGRGSGHE